MVGKASSFPDVILLPVKATSLAGGWRRRQGALEEPSIVAGSLHRVSSSQGRARLGAPGC